MQNARLAELARAFCKGAARVSIQGRGAGGQTRPQKQPLLRGGSVLHRLILLASTGKEEGSTPCLS